MTNFTAQVRLQTTHRRASVCSCSRALLLYGCISMAKCKVAWHDCTAAWLSSAAGERETRYSSALDLVSSRESREQDSIFFEHCWHRQVLRLPVSPWCLPISIVYCTCASTSIITQYPTKVMYTVLSTPSIEHTLRIAIWTFKIHKRGRNQNKEVWRLV